jgi:TIR domain
MVMIVISYRRPDSAAMTARIFDRLIAHYGKDAVFLDTDDIPASVDFRQHINETLLKTSIVLAIVGPRWLGVGADGNNLIGDESDPVRIEVETALRQRVPIIPVLIDTARMPDPEQLPSVLKDFAFKNALRVDTGQDFEYHMDRLVKKSDSFLSSTTLVAPQESGYPSPPASSSVGSSALPVAALMQKRRQVRPQVNASTPAIRNVSTSDRVQPQMHSQSDRVASEPVAARPVFPPDAAPAPPVSSQPPMTSRQNMRWRAQAVIIGAALVAAAAYIWRHDLALAATPILKLLGIGSNPSMPIATAPEPKTPADIVDVSAFAPTSARAGDDVLIQILLHAPDARGAATALAREADADAQARGLTTLAVGVQPGQRIDIVLEAVGAQIDEASQSIVWQGEPRSFQFALHLPAELAGRNCIVKARVLVGSMPVGVLRFTLKVSRNGTTADPDLVGEVARRYRQAFLSYSHEDRVKVLAYAQLLDAIGIKYFQDVASLRTMEDWEPRLHSAIDECDLFLLFWTASASRSEWVEREARYAVARRRKTNEAIPDVMPVFLEPQAPKPPDWIKDRHFDSMLRLAMQGAQADLLALKSKQ